MLTILRQSSLSASCLEITVSIHSGILSDSYLLLIASLLRNLDHHLSFRALTLGRELRTQSVIEGLSYPASCTTFTSSGQLVPSENFIPGCSYNLHFYGQLFLSCLRLFFMFELELDARMIQRNNSVCSYWNYTRVGVTKYGSRTQQGLYHTFYYTTIQWGIGHC